MKKKKLIDRIWKHRDYYLMLLPAVVYVIIFCYLPMYGLQIAFRDFKIKDGITKCDIEELKRILKKEFKNKAIPGQPTTSSGKPYKEIYYTSIMVEVDDMNHVQQVQSEINALGYQASSNAEWVQSMQGQYNYIQLALGGIGAVSLIVAAIGIANTMMMSISPLRYSSLIVSS